METWYENVMMKNHNIFITLIITFAVGEALKSDNNVFSIFFFFLTKFHENLEPLLQKIRAPH